MPTLEELNVMEQNDAYVPREALPGGDMDTLGNLSTVKDIDKKSFTPNAVQQFAGRVVTDLTFGLEQTLARDGLVFMGNLNTPSRDSEKNRQQYLRRLEAEAEGTFVGEVTAEPEGFDYNLGKAVRNTGWNWYFNSQKRMKELGMSWTTEEGVEAHPVATQLADASVSLLSCIGGYAIASSAAKGVLMATSAENLVTAVNAARIAGTAEAIGKGVAVGGIATVTGAETYLKGIDKGYTQQLSLALGIADGTLEGALELWGLDNFLKKGASKVLYVARNALVQGSEEFLQGAKQGLLHTWSGLRKYDGPETYLDILSESLMAGAIGAITGGVAGTGLAITVHSDMVKSFTDIGMKKTEAVALANEAWRAAMDEAVGVLDEDIDPGIVLGVEERFNYIDRNVARSKVAERLVEGGLEEEPRTVATPQTEVIPGADLALKGRITQIDAEIQALENQKANVTVQLNMAADKDSQKLLAQQLEHVENQLFEKDAEKLAYQIGPQFSTEETTEGKQIGEVKPLAKVTLKAGALDQARNLAARQQLNKFKEGVKAGRQVTLAEVKALQRIVVNTITQSEVLTDTQKRRMLETIPAVQTETKMLSRVAGLELKIQELENANLRKTYERAIGQILKKSVDKKFDAKTRDIFDRLLRLSKEAVLDPAEFQKKWAEEGMEFEDILSYDLAVLKSGQATLPELETIYEDFKSLFQEGVDKAKARRKMMQAEREAAIAQTKKDMAGEGIESDPNAPERQGGPRIWGLNRYTFDTIVRRLANRSKARVGESAMERRFNTAKAVETSRGMRYVFSRKNLANYAKSFGLDNQAAVLDSMESDETTMLTFTWETGGEMVVDPLTGQETVADNRETHSVTLSKAQVRKRVMEWQRAVGRRALVKENMFTEELMQDMQDSLSAQDFEYINSQFQLYDELYRMVNSLYRKLRGTSLPYDEFYSHLFTKSGAEQQVSAIDTMLNDAKRPTFMVSATEMSEFKRAKGGRALKAVSDIFAMDKYINDMSHFMGHATLIDDTQKILLSKDIRAVMETQYGESMTKFIEGKVDEFRRGKLQREANSAFSWIDDFRLRMVKGVLAVNPKIGVKQLVSTFAYLSDVPVVDFMKGLADLPRAIESGDIYKLTESFFMQTRGDTYERDLVLLKQLSENAKKGQWDFGKGTKFDHFLLGAMRLGDRGAIYAGGWALFKYDTEVRKMSEVDALRHFQEFTNKTQQSGDISQMPGEIASPNPWVRLLTTFKQAQYQYFNQYMDTIWNAKRMSPAEVGRKLFVYHAILPTVWQFAANAFRWDARDQLRALILGPAGELVIVGDALHNIVNWGWAKIYNEKDPGWQSNNDLLQSYAKDVGDTLDGFYSLFEKGGVTAEEGLTLVKDLASALTPALGAFAGIPKQAISMAEGFGDMEDGEYLKGLYHFLGYSDYAIEGKDRKKKGKKSSSGII